MTHADLPLFTWTPPRQVIVFPMAKRVGRIRDVAEKMLSKPTDRAAAFYRDQVSSSLCKSMATAGIREDEQREHLKAFWESVQAEMIRLTYHRPPGSKDSSK